MVAKPGWLARVRYCACAVLCLAKNERMASARARDSVDGRRKAVTSQKKDSTSIRRAVASREETKAQHVKQGEEGRFVL